MKIKTSKLEGAALDYAVAVCEKDVMNCPVFWPDEGNVVMASGSGCMRYSPSSKWSQAGPIIEREGISSYPVESDDKIEWWCRKDGVYTGTGQTPLIAAMRCYVASKLGDVVEIPESLLERTGE